MSVCKGCGQEIRWIEMISGKRMPIDPKPQRMVMLIEDLPEGTVSNFQPDKGIIVTVYVTHWSTCPKAKDFKKGGS